MTCDQTASRWTAPPGEVLPPDVGESDHEFTVHDGRIRFGLDAVKGVGYNAVEAIKAAREDGPFSSIWDFCERVDFRAVNGKALDSLIRCGAFTSTGATRQGMLAVVEDAQQVGKKVQQDAAAGQGSIFDFGDPEPGGGDGSGPAHPGSAHPPIPTGEFDQRELLAMEDERATLLVASAKPFAPTQRQIEAASGAADAREARRHVSVAPQELRLRIDGTGVTSRDLDDLERVLRAHPGAASVLTTIGTSEGPRVLRLGASFDVAPSARLVDELDAIFGPGSAEVVRLEADEVAAV